MKCAAIYTGYSGNDLYFGYTDEEGWTLQICNVPHYIKAANKMLSRIFNKSPSQPDYDMQQWYDIEMP